MRAAAAALLAGGLAPGCAEFQQSHPEVPVRVVVPVPVCTTQLAPPKRQAGGRAVIRSLDPEKWMTILVPKLDLGRGLGPTDLDCTGQYVFANEILRHGIPPGDWPQVIDPDDMFVGAGPEGLRALWLRALKFDNGDAGGPVALVRGIDDRAEIYGIGSFRAPANAELRPARMGNENIVVAEAKRCPDKYNCWKEATFFLLRRGRLLGAATVDLERVKRVPSVTERGLYAEYRMRTDVQYQPDGIRLLEQVQVRIIPYEEGGDRDSDRLLRTVEFGRKLKVQRDALFATNESVWERVVGQD
ncbi:MAG: hypothetical protein HY744_28795 [Deltaproteobacteria bacterium]|nr:hypothetical protein [Deltaproteobacteria bacterium]